jgi:hypothetical protein
LEKKKKKKKKKKKRDVEREIVGENFEKREQVRETIRK